MLKKIKVNLSDFSHEDNLTFYDITLPSAAKVLTWYMRGNVSTGEPRISGLYDETSQPLFTNTSSDPITGRFSVGTEFNNSTGYAIGPKLRSQVSRGEDSVFDLEMEIIYFEFDNN